MKLIIEGHFYIVFENRILHLYITAEVIIVYDDNNVWSFDIHYN
jgi:hypothetical protein